MCIRDSTGDGGTLTDGQLTISDRKKDVIISGGENVSSIEVEDCLYSHPAVAEAAVIGVPHEKWGETVKALVVLREGNGAVTEAELIAHCKQRLAGYKSPTTVEFREALPRTATGKLQKFRLREPYWVYKRQVLDRAGAAGQLSGRPASAQPTRPDSRAARASSVRLRTPSLCIADLR